MWARTNCLLLLANAGLLLGPTHQECGGVLFSSTTHGTVQYFLPLSDSINGDRCSWILPDNAEAVQLEVVPQQTVSWAVVGCNSAYLEIKLEATENEREFCGLFWSVPKGGRKLVIRGQGPGIIVLEAPVSGFEHGLTLRYLEGATVKIPTKLILDMSFNLHLKDSKSDEYQKLAKDFALKISPFYDTIPGFQQLQIKRFSAGSVKIEFDAIFRLTKIESFLLDPDLIFNVSGLWLVISGGFEIGGARVVTVYVTEKVIALCGEVLFCQNGFQCVHSKSGNVSCTSLCHTAYCKNSGICIHNRGQAPMCQCPVGSDYWFMGPRCDHRMTNQILVAIAFGVALALLVVLAAVAFLVLRRFKVVLTEAKIDQTRSSYKRFSRFDDFSNQHQSQSWLSFSVNSLDNPGFSNSDELIHLQILDTSLYSCYEESVTGTYSSQRTGPHGQPAFRHSLQNLDASINSINEYMGDSGKASDMSVCSWPGEPFRWSPFPILYQLGRERPFKARRPHSYYEGMELVSMERNWTA
ncbi:interphotoreceptor matrix proteoglycan 2 isoform X1 [Hypanus sabinus]|uniref:interphotoreceptor matrix proteoglycan 2 isoform X1 n=1 Tax=Hypanus sabinus TaxID=79690 RepID=UPI0028C39C6A|nr:interphotoreceptor matrix proteoglycan 2 isoform X1 [Hypanus sabinus]